MTTASPLEQLAAHRQRRPASPPAPVSGQRQHRAIPTTSAQRPEVVCGHRRHQITLSAFRDSSIRPELLAVQQRSSVHHGQMPGAAPPQPLTR
jgi:hypothetical protein